jgi:hypothetical protein
VTITQGVTIEAPAGVTAFFHPPSGDAITINAGTATVTLRGLTLSVGTGNGVTVNAVGTLNVESCTVTKFANVGVLMNSAGRLHVKGTDIKSCLYGVALLNTSGTVLAFIDHSHLDGNGAGFGAATTSPGGSVTIATNTTANNNNYGWVCGNGTSGKDVLNLEFCTGSGNSTVGLFASSSNAQTSVRYSSCVFSGNGSVGVEQVGSSSVQSRGNNTLTGNGSPTGGTIGSFPAM